MARRGSASFVKITDALMGFNEAWADWASVLIVTVAQLSIQAQHEGLHTHQMGGFDGTAIAAADDLTAELLLVND